MGHTLLKVELIPGPFIHLATIWIFDPKTRFFDLDENVLSKAMFDLKYLTHFPYPVRHFFSFLLATVISFLAFLPVETMYLDLQKTREIIEFGLSWGMNFSLRILSEKDEQALVYDVYPRLKKDPSRIFFRFAFNPDFEKLTTLFIERRRSRPQKLDLFFDDFDRLVELPLKLRTKFRRDIYNALIAFENDAFDIPTEEAYFREKGIKTQEDLDQHLIDCLLLK